MAEYIAKYPDYPIAKGFALDYMSVHERIVRCRDCYYYNSAWTLHVEGKHARQMDCYGVGPNGFCSWGKPMGGD